MSLREKLLGGRLRKLVVALVVAGLVVVAAVTAGVLGAPTVTGVHNEFGTVSDERTEVKTNLTVRNPNPFGLHLAGVSLDYTVSMAGVAVANGSKDGVSIPSGNSTVSLTTSLHNERIPDWWVAHLRNGEQSSLAVEATVHSDLAGRSITKRFRPQQIETDILGQFNSTTDRPVNAGLPGVEDPVAVITQQNGSWGHITDARTPIEVAFRVHNPKSVPLTVAELGYDVHMNDVDVGEGATERTYVIPPGATETVRMTVVLDNSELDEWWVSHLANDQRTELVIDFYARVSVGDVKTVRVPLKGATYEKEIETNIFGGDGAVYVNGTTSAGAGGNATTSTTTSTTSTTEGESALDSTLGETTTEGDGTTTTTTATTTTTEDDGVFALADRRP